MVVTSAEERADGCEPVRSSVAGGGTGRARLPDGRGRRRAARRAADVRVVFVGTPRGIETRVVPERGDELELLDVLPMKGGGLRRCVPRRALVPRRSCPRRAIARARLAPERRALGRRLRGGPGRRSRRALARVPLAILEPNSVLGLANRWLARSRARLRRVPGDRARHSARAWRVAPAFRCAGRFAPRAYVAEAGRDARARARRKPGRRGAERAVPARIAAAVAQVARAVDVVHQAGRDRDDEVRARYDELGVAARATVVAVHRRRGRGARPRPICHRSAPGPVVARRALRGRAPLDPRPVSVRRGRPPAARTRSRSREPAPRSASPQDATAEARLATSCAAESVAALGRPTLLARGRRRRMAEAARRARGKAAPRESR